MNIVKNNNNSEVWRAVAGYERLYQISNLGNVRSLDRAIRERNTGKIVNRKGKQLKPCVNTGYLAVGLGRHGAIKTHRVHRLVASAFIAGRNEKNCVTNHKNGDKLDNRAKNLEWCSIGYNLKHAYNMGLKQGRYYPRKEPINVL